MRRTIPLGSNIVPLAEVERQTILNALERLNGNKLMTARALGIGKTTLYRKLKEYGICAPMMGRPLGQR
jgi:two-component system response regulator HydG